jgi:hypothetical protein
MEPFGELSQKEAMRRADDFANQMTEVLKKRNSELPVDRKSLISLDQLPGILVQMYVSFLAQQYIIVEK